MIKRKRWNSIRWRIVLIYFLLVFIAMSIIGVFILNQLESYQMDSIRNSSEIIVQDKIMVSLQIYDDLDANQETIQKNIVAWSDGLLEEMFVINQDFKIIAASNENLLDQKAESVLSQNVLSDVMSGKKAEEDSIIGPLNIPVKNMLFPVRENGNGEVIGAICLRADVSSVYNIQARSKDIFLQAMLIALVVTVVLGFFIARSITVPINDVTTKAEQMAQGDFSQMVDIKSDDEIGRLAEMFNLMREKLDYTLSEISNEKSKLETILKYMADGLLAIDLSGMIIHANPAAMDMLSIMPEDIVEKSYNDIIAGISKDLLFDQLRERCTEEGGQDVFDYAGSTFAVRYDRFRDENDMDRGIILIVQDITEQQKLENMQMDFVANVSHELKTPLTTIKSYTETLMDGAAEDKEMCERFLGIIDSEADRMNRLVKDLLQLSRIDYNKDSWTRKDTNLISLLKSAVSKVEMTAKQKSLHVNCIFNNDEQILVTMDKDGIEQVLLNVLSNAIKYTVDGGRIDIDALQLEYTAKIVVSDNGIGISEVEIPRVFERFYRVDKARSREMGGTGLGLAISKQIIEAHKGTIEIESQLGKGTKVIIQLPLAVKRGVKNIE